ncbi:MAG: NUDIX domain-containing protein [Bacilli bacterium]
MEIIDVLDSSGNIIDKKPRSLVLKEGLLHRTVHVWIINNNNEILLQKRNPKKDTFPGLWAISTAGHVNTEEDSKSAAIRELKEELNIDTKELTYLFTIRRNQQLGDLKINSFDDVYLLKKDIDIKNTKLQKNELTDIKYIKINELKKIYKENNKDYVPSTIEHQKLFQFLKDGFQFRTKVIYSEEEYLKLNLDHLKRDIFNKIIILIVAFIGIIGLANKTYLSLFALIFILGFIYGSKYLTKIKTKKLYKSLETKEEDLIFFKEYFITEKYENNKIYYTFLKRIIETKENFYLYINSKQAFLVVKKDLLENDIKFLQQLKKK